MDPTALEHCQQVLEYTFRDPHLLVCALTHSSVATSRVDSNERMEFLGDSVLGLVVCEKLYREHVNYLEGEMTKVKSAVVSRRMCAEVADEIGITEMLLLGKGVGGHRMPPSLAAAVLESIIGSIYLDGGLEPVREFIDKHLSRRIKAIIASQHAENYKSILQQYAQRQWNATPYYEVLDEKGPDHSKAFEVCVVVEGRRFHSAWGNNKKEAEQLAAKAALLELNVIDDEAAE